MTKNQAQENYMEACRLQVLSSAAIQYAMDNAELSRSQLAEKIEARESYVDEVLDGEIHMTLALLARFGLACGVALMDDVPES